MRVQAMKLVLPVVLLLIGTLIRIPEVSNKKK